MSKRKSPIPVPPANSFEVWWQDTAYAGEYNKTMCKAAYVAGLREAAHMAKDAIEGEGAASDISIEADKINQSELK